MRYARRLVQLLEADLARERARIVELNATIEILLAERNDYREAMGDIPPRPAATIAALETQVANLENESDEHRHRAENLEAALAEQTDIRADLLGENTELVAERDRLLAERDEYPSHHAAYNSGRRAVLAAVRNAIAGIDLGHRHLTREGLVAHVTEALVAEEEQTE